MIAALRGEVVALELDSVVLMVGGVGMRAHATPATLASLRLGAACELSTSLVVREDSLTLYGFADTEERETFELVQTVSGVGPRLALAILAVHTPDALRRAVANEDLAALVRVPGIGRKGASRIVLELADRLGPPMGSSVAPAQAPTETTDVVTALVGLGWPQRQAEEAVQHAVEAAAQAPGHGASTIDAASLLRTALRILAGDAHG